MLEGKNFLITGATGRLGCETVLRLEDLGASVQPLVLPGYPREPKRVVWKARNRPIPVYGRTDLEVLEEPDYVINFHWVIDRTVSFTDQLFFETSNNIHRPAFLWEWLQDKPLARFINISSVKVFSTLNRGPISSETEPRPGSPYGIAKLTAENYFDTFFCRSGWPVAHLRLCSVAACGEHPSHLMSRLYASAFEDQAFTLNRGNICTILYIDEVVDLIISAALSAACRRYIIAAEPVTTDFIASMFEKVSQKRIHAEYTDQQSGTVDQFFISDREKLREWWTRTVPLATMIRLYIGAQKNAGNSFRNANPHWNGPEDGYHAKST